MYAFTLKLTFTAFFSVPPGGGDSVTKKLGIFRYPPHTMDGNL